MLKKLNREITDVLWLMILQGLAHVFPLLVFPYLGAVLGASGLGIVNFGISFILTLTIILDFGFNMSATKRIARASDQSSINKIATETLFAKLLLLCVCAIITVALMAIPRYAPYRWSVAIMFPTLIGNIFTLNWFYQGLGKIRQVSIISCACQLAVMPLIFLLVRDSTDVLKASFIMSLIYILPGVLIGVRTIKIHLFRIVPTSWSDVVTTIHNSFPLFLSNASSAVYAVLFVVILGYFSTPYEVGRYSIAEKVMRATCNMMLFPTLQVFFPKVSTLFGEDELSAQRLIHRIVQALLTLTVLISAGIFFGGERLMDFLGKDYQNMRSLFHIMAFAPIFIVLGGICGQLGLVACGGEKQHKEFRNTYMIGACVALVLVLALSSILNAQWMAVCLLITEAVVGTLMFLFYKKSTFTTFHSTRN